MKRVFLLLLLSSLLFTGCAKNDGDKTELTDKKVVEASVQHRVTYVKTESAVLMEFTNILSLPGLLHPKEEVIVTSKVNGTVQSIFGDVGSTVNKGQVLCKIDDTLFKLQYEKATTGLNVEKVKYENAQKYYERFKSLYENQAISQVELENVESQYHLAKESLALSQNDYLVAKENLEYTNIYTPLSGIISVKDVANGENIGPGETLFSIVNIDNLFVEIGVLEKDIGLVRIGQQVSVKIDSLADMNIPGKIENIGPVQKESTKAYPVNILIDNKEKLLKPGMFATVEIVTETRKNVIGLPKEAIIQENGDYFVFVKKEGKAVKKQVAIGIINNGYQEITDGILIDEVIIIAGQDRLVDGSVVEVK